MTFNRCISCSRDVLRGSPLRLSVVLLAFMALAVFLTPAIWSVADDLFSGEHFQDTPAMTMSLIVTLFSTIFAALIVHLRNRRARDGEES